MRYNDSLIKTTKARNEYILLVEGTKAVLSKYFDHDVSDLVSVSIGVALSLDNVVEPEFLSLVE